MHRLFFSFISILMLISCQKEYDTEDYGSLTDSRDGKAYKTVSIGNQIWMAENLKYLPEVSSPVKFSDTTQYYYVYDYYGTRVDRAEQTLNYDIYGVLYNYSVAINSCPEGWRLPGEDDWKELSSIVGEENGRELRSKQFWVSVDKGVNSTGFNVLPAGCQEGGYFRLIGQKAGFWSSKQSAEYPGRAYVWGFHHDVDVFEPDTTSRANAFPVRCVMD